MRRNGHGKPVVSLDIDGTLGDYHGHFLRFAEGYFGRRMPEPTKINPGKPLWAFMGVRRAEYRDCKLAYRQGGMKRSMPCLEGASALTRDLRALGAEVWICTTRPYMRLDNVDPDTQEWLRRNKIEYDALLYDPRDGDAKYAELKRQAGIRRVVGVAEDLPEQAMRAIKAGFGPVWLRNQPYNKTAWEYDGRYINGREIKPEDVNPNVSEPYEVHRWDTAEELLKMARLAVERYW
jgi:hypothetical protein